MSDNTQDAVSVTGTQADRDAAADLMSDMGCDWGFCGDVRHGRTDHKYVSAFARHRLAIAPGGAASVEREGVEAIALQVADTIEQHMKSSAMIWSLGKDLPDDWMTELRSITVAALESEIPRRAALATPASKVGDEATSPPVDGEKVREGVRRVLLGLVGPECEEEYDAVANALDVIFALAGQGEAIPAGMKPWAGGDSAPADIGEASEVMHADGTIGLANKRSILWGRPQRKPGAATDWERLGPRLESKWIIAYTPSTTPARKSGEDAVPEGMAPWAGRDRAPNDWDGGPVMMRNGELSAELARGLAPDGKPKSGRWHWYATPAIDDVIAYTPRSQPADPHPQGDPAEALAFARGIVNGTIEASDDNKNLAIHKLLAAFGGADADARLTDDDS